MEELKRVYDEKLDQKEDLRRKADYTEMSFQLVPLEIYQMYVLPLILSWNLVLALKLPIELYL
jgi:hypothetical protein